MSPLLPTRTIQLFSRVFAIVFDADAHARTAGLRSLSGRGDGRSAVAPVQWLSRPEVVDALSKAAGPHLLVHTRQDIHYWTTLQRESHYSMVVVLYATSDPTRLELEARVQAHDGSIIVWLYAELRLFATGG